MLRITKTNNPGKLVPKNQLSNPPIDPEIRIVDQLGPLDVDIKTYEEYP